LLQRQPFVDFKYTSRDDVDQRKGFSAASERPETEGVRSQDEDQPSSVYTRLILPTIIMYGLNV